MIPWGSSGSPKQKTSQELAMNCHTVREANVEGGYSDLRQCLEWLCEVKLLAKSLGFVSGPTEGRDLQGGCEDGIPVGFFFSSACLHGAYYELAQLASALLAITDPLDHSSVSKGVFRQP